ncbi:hypothetical protein BET10_14020 [Pseudoalteromonas amylolytica]|uniref:ABC transporter ATP-binding protein n=1 Tax=Pseudoalteromonas amylolytica TaxID=1859457 RepID=A0A1S1MVT5_9GAMM|nr:hypothetical protein BFC16_20955 [Pseudoalteromonas sp. JW3]OHU89905.1 hypothetical protein BET10_14020 [Pseudoalteromonas amylolytica]
MDDLIWPLSNLHVAASFLASNIRGASVCPEFTPATKSAGSSDANLDDWFEQAANCSGIDIQNNTTNYPAVSKMLMHCGPCILMMPGNGFIVLLKTKRQNAVILNNRQQSSLLPLTKLKDILIKDHVLPLRQSLSKQLLPLGLPTKQHKKVLESLLIEKLANTPVIQAWLFRPAAYDNIFEQFKQAKFLKGLILSIGAALLFQIMLILSWYVIGLSVFETNDHDSVFSLWALLLFSAIPFYYLSLKIKNRLSLDFGAELRKQLLQGILKLKPNDVRRHSSGHFMGQVMDIDLLEAQSFSMSFIAITALTQVFLAGVILAVAGVSWSHSILLIALLILIGMLSSKYYREIKRWLAFDLQLNCKLSEQLVGHRTRFIQEMPEQRHLVEDEDLSNYTKLCEQLDKWGAVLTTFAGRRVWLFLSLLLLMPELTSDNVDVASLSVCIGAILLAAISLEQFANSVKYLLEATCAWVNLRPIYEGAADTRENSIQPQASFTHADLKGAEYPTIRARELHFSFNKRKILDGCDFGINAKDKVLLEGNSGAGKSTLGYVIAGAYMPQQGELSLNGTSFKAVYNELWRKKIVMAPQFHDNYLFSQTLAFNLLMGRCWPPSEADLIDAQTVCEELDLGKLINKMPAGLHQMVGEGGWSLSHGEQSRVFIARALLQRADLIILDESFSSLDPKTFNIALPCVLKRSNALLLIAHP